jgi:hypothetical protein
VRDACEVEDTALEWQSNAQCRVGGRPHVRVTGECHGRRAYQRTAIVRCELRRHLPRLHRVLRLARVQVVVMRHRAPFAEGELDARGETEPRECEYARAAEGGDDARLRMHRRPFVFVDARLIIRLVELLLELLIVRVLRFECLQSPRRVSFVLQI